MHDFAVVESTHEFWFDREVGIIRQVWRGELSFEAIAAGAEALRASSVFRPGVPILTDLRDCPSTLSRSEVGKLARLIGSLGLGAAALVVNRPKETALSVLYMEEAAKQRAIEIFSTEEEAVSFLRQAAARLGAMDG